MKRKTLSNAQYNKWQDQLAPKLKCFMGIKDFNLHEIK